MHPYSPHAFFDLVNPLAASLFDGLTYVWDGVAALPGFIENHIEPRILGEVEYGAWLDPGRVSLGKGSRVERGAIVRGPTIIGSNSVVRTGAYIRGHALICDRCVIGTGAEIRQCLVLDDTRLPHLNLVFTSLIGNRVNMAGRTSTANFRFDGKEVQIRVPVDGNNVSFPTGQTLFGVIMGDDSKAGGNVLIMPGTVIGRDCIISPLALLSGYIPHRSRVRVKSEPLEIEPRRDL